ncbi:MAG TPA: MFS transporter, partial [Planctomycetota bacterium]|nr:MFS transporter [Planctomycetota bacterium]
MTVVASTAPPLSPKLNFQLSLMMFLQYGIWGAWLPILFPYMGYMGFKPLESVAIFFVGAVGAIIGPFLAGQVADRYFNTEKFLAVSHILGGIMVWFLSSVHSFGAFLVFSLFYGLIYAPTLALTNSLTFHHVPDRDRDFGKIRVWGTIGWIVVGIAVGQWLAAAHTPRGPEAIEAAAAKYHLAAGTPAETIVATAQNAGRADAFRFSAILGIVMGLFCLVLPKTPPAKFSGNAGSGDAAIKKNATLEALGEIKH